MKKILLSAFVLAGICTTSMAQKAEASLTRAQSTNDTKVAPAQVNTEKAVARKQQQVNTPGLNDQQLASVQTTLTSLDAKKAEINNNQSLTKAERTSQLAEVEAKRKSVIAKAKSTSVESKTKTKVATP